MQSIIGTINYSQWLEKEEATWIREQACEEANCDHQQAREEANLNQAHQLPHEQLDEQIRHNRKMAIIENK